MGKITNTKKSTARKGWLFSLLSALIFSLKSELTNKEQFDRDIHIIDINLKILALLLVVQASLLFVLLFVSL